MVKLVIHPGWWKTGTTAVQDHLSRKYEELREKGILYPRAGRHIDNAHHGLALSLEAKRGLHYPQASSQVIDEILAEATGCSVILISSELMPNIFRSEEGRAFALNFSEIELIFTIRPQDQLILSLFKQLVKDADIMFQYGMFEVAGENLKRLDFLSVVDDWVVHGGISLSQVKILLYSANVVNEFCGLIGLDSEGVGGRRANESPSDYTIAVLHELMAVRAKLPKEERIGLLAFVNSNLSSVVSKYRLMTKSQREAITALFAPSNQALAEKYLGRSRLFGEEEVQLEAADCSCGSNVTEMAQLLSKMYFDSIERRSHGS